MSEEQDDLTLVYMYGFKNGEQGMKAEIERLRAALHEWDALIRHQYSGSQEAMSDMTYAAQRTAHVLHGEEPWPMQTRVEKLEAALREYACNCPSGFCLSVGAENNDVCGDAARAALEGEKAND